MALDELLCRLADNYWVSEGHGHGTKIYDNPLDIGFLRDVDPTVLPGRGDSNTAQGAREEWVLDQNITISATTEKALEKWPYLADPGNALATLIRRSDRENRSWATLYDHRRVAVRYDNERPRLHGLRQQEFRFVCAVVIRKSKKRRFLAEILRRRKIDGYVWGPPEYVDGPFLRESYWRSTGSDEKWRENWSFPKAVGVAFPVSDYRWESHLDASLPKGASAFVPSPWLIRELDLVPARYDGSLYCDRNGDVRFIGSYLEPKGSSALIDADLFRSYLDRLSLDCVWLFLAERGAWPGGGERAVWRRSEGVCWIENGRPGSKTWKEDRNNLHFRSGDWPNSKPLQD
jgi:hypothetical protein